MGKTKAIGFQPYKSITPLPEKEIVELCDRWKIREFYLFDTILKNQGREFYDLDAMVVFEPDAHWGWNFISLEEELSMLFNREINLATKAGVEGNRNELSRKQKLEAAKLIYVAR